MIYLPPKLWRNTALVVGTIVCWMPMLIAAASGLRIDQDSLAPSPLHFTEVKAFVSKEKNLRKWDTPVVADLDDDGYPDLLLNDHGFGLHVRWNNNGRFATPYDIVMGDLHGVTVADYDRDGRPELFVSRGGGSGSNARNAKVYRVEKGRKFTVLPDFDTPLAAMRGRTLRLVDADNDGDLDLLNFAFPDGQKNGRSENYLYRNDGRGGYQLQDTLPRVKRNGQKTLITDFDGDNIPDLLLYGDGEVRAFRGKKNFAYEEVSAAVLPTPIEDVTAVAEVDYDNDGDWDLVMTRGREFERTASFYDEDTRVWGFFTKRGPFSFPDLEIGDLLWLENFQSQWPHKSIYLGESAYAYEYPGETHSGRDVRLLNSDAFGFPDDFPEKGAYLGYVGNRKWRLGGDLWAPATGIIHGVRNHPVTEAEPGPRDVLLENRDGVFVAVSEKNAPFLAEHSAGLAVGDLNNDGWQDIIVMPRGDLVHPLSARVYLNDSQGNFAPAAAPKIVSSELGAIGMAINVLDYDRDGWLDVLVGNERGKWRLFRNTTAPNSPNRQVSVRVGPSPSGKATALGATVLLEGCGTERRLRVGSSAAAYSGDANNLLHFGLGNCEEPARVTVRWTNGEEKKQKLTAQQSFVEIRRGK